jgi:lactate dehydrogenase-like 2-hydroxyacid dehydrogenase
MKIKILIPDRLEEPADIEESVFGDEFDVILYQAKSSLDIPQKDWEECNAVLAWHDINYTSELLAKMKNCKVIVRVGVGYDNVDLVAARENNIIVSNIPDYGTDDVADHSMALILTISRGILEYNNSAKSGFWSWDKANNLSRIKGSTLGIIGLGRIGTAVALRAKSFGLKVIFYDPYKDYGYEKALSIERVDSLLELAKHSDIITIHTPLTEETNKMIDVDFFNKCKNDSILINTARGTIVDLDDLYEAMVSSKISKVGLDVLPVEPPDTNHPLIKKWYSNDKEWEGRIIITPHSAFYNSDSYIEMRKKAAEEALRVLLKQKPLYRISNGK